MLNSFQHPFEIPKQVRNDKVGEQLRKKRRGWLISHPLPSFLTFLSLEERGLSNCLGIRDTDIIKDSIITRPIRVMFKHYTQYDE